MKCVLCGCKTELVAILSESNRWMLKSDRVPMCTECFDCLKDHKYYREVDGECNYLLKEK